MDLQQTLNILNSSSISKETIGELEVYARKYPYSSLFQSLLLKAYNATNNIHYQQQLFLTATSAPNREHLKLFLEKGFQKTIQREEKIVPTGPYNIEDLADESIEYQIGLNKKQQKDRSLIDRFIAEPKKEKETNTLYTPEKAAEKSLDDSSIMISETLANIYIMQNQIEKAIECFEILSLKYPEKNTYFASRIKKLKEENK